MTGDELKQLRLEATLSQTGLARLLDVTVTTISRWENAVHPIDHLRADAIRARIARHREKKKTN